MGRVVTPKYRVEYRDNHLMMGKRSADMISSIDGRPVLTMAWRRERPTKKFLENWRKVYNESFLPGGSNEHISEIAKSIPYIFYARIVEQKTGKVICETHMPTFEVA